MSGTVGSASQRARFPGLDSLRFYAALLVLLGHVPLNQESRGLPHPTFGALSYRAAPAVSFFFTLSGFLITYLLLEELRRQGSVDVPAFYLRRVLRIWPLYFLVVGFGLLFYNLMLPALGISYQVTYPFGLAVFLYVFFLPNLMNSLFTVGGILNPTWSIGVEEQFYLAWAPLVKRWHARLPLVCAGVFLISMTSFVLNEVHGSGWSKMFLGQLKFHYMAAGALSAWLVLRQRERLFGSPAFASRAWQSLLWLVLLQHVLVGALASRPILEELAQALIFPWLILETALNPRRLFSAGNRGSEWLGGISYGFYMLHMPAIYAASFVFQRTEFWRGRPALYVLAYYLLATALTTLLAFLSYRLLETPMLALKSRFAR